MWSDLDSAFCIAVRDAAFKQASSRNMDQGVNLIQKHFTIKVRGLKRPICQLVTPDTPDAESKRATPAGSSGETSGANIPVAARDAKPPVDLEAEVVMGDPNAYFDELASKRWRQD